MLLDIDYLLLGMPGLVATVWAQARLHSAFKAASRIEASSGLTGAEAADDVMDAGGASGVSIELADGQLADHYDAGHKVLRLSRKVHDGRSLAALGIAVHEAGHAIQQASRYPGLIVRNAIVPLAGVVSTVFWIVLLAGLFLGMFRLILAALYLLELAVVIQLINLPVEFDASRRARQILLLSGAIDSQEKPQVGRVLNAAAWTYVAGTLTSFLMFLSYVFLSGSRRRQVEPIHSDRPSGEH
jgi:Zn-dependent membrane protease YugP